MNLLKSPLRRSVAAVAGAFIGLTGAFALAAPASAHTPDISVSTDCAAEGGWSVTWTVIGKWTNGSTGLFTKVESTEGGSKLTKISTANTVGIVGDTSISETQTFPNSVERANLEVWLNWDDRGQNFPGHTSKGVEKKQGCSDSRDNPPGDSDNPPTKPATPPADVAPAEPTPIVEFDCDTMTIGLDNPKNGVKITLTLETSKGEKRTLTVKPGEKKTTKFSATPGFTVKVGAKEVDETTTIAYEKPDDCAAAGSGGGGGLPVTGANATTIAGVAGGVLVIGAALFFVARRRKIKFTA